MKQRTFILLSIILMILSLTTTSYAALIDNGDGTITDTDTGLMWLRDASLGGPMTWYDALTWADALVYAGYNNWKLPSALNSDGSGPCGGLNCTDTELGHLYYIEGVTSSTPSPFTNVQLPSSNSGYWTSTESPNNPDVAWNVSFIDGSHGGDEKYHDWHSAWAVRNLCQEFYFEDFGEDYGIGNPIWETNNSLNFYRDPSDNTFYIKQVNINYSGEYAYFDLGSLGYTGGTSFRMEWDTYVISHQSLTAFWFGIYDTSLQSNESGNYIYTHLPEQTNDLLAKKGLSGWAVDYDGSWHNTTGIWYHTIMEYDSTTETITADVYDRTTNGLLAEFSLENVGTFASDMDRIGSSNVREGTYTNPGNDTTVKIDNVTFCSGYEPPTLIELSYFTATRQKDNVLVEWETEMEIDCAGFRIWRSKKENGNYELITNSLIPCEGDGTHYEFVDESARKRKKYYYKLEDFDLFGISTMHGPVPATRE